MWKFCVFLILYGGAVVANGECLAEQIRINNPVPEHSFFSITMAIDGSTMVFGSPNADSIGLGFDSGAAFIMQESASGVADWTLTAQLIPLEVNEQDEFGFAVDVKADVVIVSSFRATVSSIDNAGSVFVFRETSPQTWLQETIIVDPVPQHNCYFGASVDMFSTDFIIIGSQQGDGIGENTGCAHIFEHNGASWNLVQRIEAVDGVNNDRFGGSGHTVGLEMNFAAAGARLADSHNGAVYFFGETSPGSWTQVQKELSPPDGSYDWGWHLEVQGDYVIVPQKGLKVTLFVQSSPFTWTVEATIAKPSSIGDFGEYISMNSLHQLVIGASTPANDGTLGLAHVYEKVLGDFTLVISLEQPTSKDGLFGHTVGISEESVVAVGAYGTEIGGGAYAGAAFIHRWECDDQCPGNTCQNGATCLDGYYTYYCDCFPSHTGTECETCACINDGVCAEDGGMHYCDCPNAVGDICDKLCYNGVPDDSRSNCNCTLSGATGKFCTNDEDDCASMPCKNGGTCTDFGDDLFPNHNHEFNCSCPTDSEYSGTTCEDTMCVSSPCLNAGTCKNGIDFACNCTLATGYEGEFCETEIDECASSPCLNDGICTDLLGDFTCNCAGTGYEGATCSEDIDDCMSSPCQNDGVCKDKGANDYKCTCNSFWEGDVCTVDVDDCLLTVNECLNGGACEDDPVNMGDVICTCIVEDGGFTGKYCDVPIEDACVTFNPCFHGGKCIVDDITKEMSCDCRDTGYEGGVCDVQVYVSECVSSPCLNGGQCYDPSDQQDDFYCDCDDTNGYFGDLCELTACDSMPCQNGGTCTNSLGGDYTCACPENYSGARCQVDENEQVGAGSSSSSSSSNVNNPQRSTDTDGGSGDKQDSGTLIIVIVIIIVIVGALVGGGLLFKRNERKFVMPT